MAPKHYPKPNGEVAGGDLPDAGIGTGVPDSYGADLGPESTNREGPLKGAGSDPMTRDKPRCEDEQA